MSLALVLLLFWDEVSPLIVRFCLISAAACCALSLFSAVAAWTLVQRHVAGRASRSWSGDSVGFAVVDVSTAVSVVVVGGSVVGNSVVISVVGEVVDVQAAVLVCSGKSVYRTLCC